MEVPAMSNTYQKRKASKEYGLYNQCKKLNDDELYYFAYLMITIP